MAKRKSKTRTVLIATFGVVVCAVGLPWGPGLMGCELDTTPRRKPPVIKPSADDADSGEERIS